MVVIFANENVSLPRRAFSDIHSVMFHLYGLSGKNALDQYIVLALCFLCPSILLSWLCFAQHLFFCYQLSLSCGSMNCPTN